MKKEIFKDKYAAFEGETPNDAHNRLAAEFAYADRNIPETYENAHRMSKYGRHRNVSTHTSYFKLFSNFKFIIPQGSILSNLGTYKLGSLSNCFVVSSPKDSYSGIFKTDEELAQVMKMRGGAGIDISNLRPEGAPVANSAKSSTGAVSFMERFSNTTKEVAQGGRRGALMITMDIRHPDIEKFIEVKKDLKKVTGANISVKMSDSFMHALEDGDDKFLLQYPVDSEEPKITKIVNPKELWDKIIDANIKAAEPGVLFWDTIQERSPDNLYEDIQLSATNPCGEIPLPEYDSCRLIAMNLTSYVKEPFTENAGFDMDLFKEHVYEAVRLGDNLIFLENERISKILQKIQNEEGIHSVNYNLWESIRETGENYRRIGIGLTGLGDMFAMLGMTYGDANSLNMAQDIMREKFISELECSVDLSILRGSFIGFSTEIESSKKSFVRNRLSALGQERLFQRMLEFGRRNISWSTVAPVGTMSIMAETSSGIEPVFSTFYKRRKKQISSDRRKPDFVDDEGVKWRNYNVIHPKFMEWIKLKHPDLSIELLSDGELRLLTEESPFGNSVADKINPIDRIEMQSIIQMYTTHAISSTINLPKDTTRETISKIYKKSWLSGLKGITVYVDGSRSGVLINDDSDKRYSPKRPREILAITNTIVSNGEEFSVFVGFLDNNPYEVFACRKNELLKSPITSGSIVKNKSGQYFYGDIPLLPLMSDAEKSITRLVSLSLRHGVPIQFIVEQLQKGSNSVASFSMGIARVLKNFIKDGAKASGKCESCGGANIIYENGCSVCRDCGSSKCG